VASARLDVLRWTLEDPGVPLDAALGDVASFLRSPLGVVARVGFPATTDQLLQAAASARLKFHRVPIPAGARASAVGSAVAILNGTTLELHEQDRVSRCALTSPADVLTIGVSPRSTLVVGVTTTSVLAWQIPGCRRILETPLPQDAVDGVGDIGGVLVLGDSDDIPMLAWWPERLLALAVSPSGTRVEGRLDAATVAGDPATALRFFDVASRPGAPVVFTAGDVSALLPDRLCIVAARTLTFGWACDYNAISAFDVDPRGRYLVWSSFGGPLQLTRVAAAAQGGPFPLDYTLAGGVLALAVSADAIVTLNERGTVTLLDLPSLTVLDAQYVGHATAQRLLGAARRSSYEPTTVDAVQNTTSVTASCGDRGFAWRPGGEVAAVSHAGGDWHLPLTEVGVAATATVTAALFEENCGRLLVALEDGTRSDVLAVDIVEAGVLSARRLARRATRTVPGRVRELRIDGTAPGWATALLETTGDPPSLVLQRVPIDRGAVLEWLEVDRHASRSSMAVVSGR
jgi:hypothetical protein